MMLKLALGTPVWIESVPPTIETHSSFPDAKKSLKTSVSGVLTMPTNGLGYHRTGGPWVVKCNSEVIVEGG